MRSRASNFMIPRLMDIPRAPPGEGVMPTGETSHERSAFTKVTPHTPHTPHALQPREQPFIAPDTTALARLRAQEGGLRLHSEIVVWSDDTYDDNF